MAEIKLWGSFASIAYHGQSLLSSAGGAPTPFQRSLRSGTAVKGKQLKLWLRKHISLWIGSPLSQVDHFLVTGGSKRWHNWVNLMAVITYRLYCFHPEKTRVLKESEKILKGSEVHCFNLLFTKSLFLKETVAFRLLNKKLKQLIDKSQSWLVD